MKAVTSIVLLFLLLASISASAAPTQHAITVSCTNAQQAAGVVLAGNKFYCSQTSGGPYSLVGTTSNPASCSFIDSPVVGGQTYYCVVTAYDSNGNESPFSLQTTAVIPLVLPVTGLTATATPTQTMLRWTQSATAGITANGVYRASSSGGPYTLLIASASPITSYADTTAVSGQPAFYVVTASTSPVQESAYSTELGITAPIQPTVTCTVK